MSCIVHDFAKQIDLSLPGRCGSLIGQCLLVGRQCGGKGEGKGGGKGGGEGEKEF